MNDATQPGDTKIFFSPLQVEVQPDGQTYKLLKPLHVRYFGHLYTIPAGFLTDFASVPRCFWNLMPPFGKYTPAAVLHDWLYQNGIVTRAQADKVFFDCMTSLEVPSWQRSLMYAGLRLGGHVAWTHYRIEDVLK
jgi:hypothetical protein